MIFSRLLHLRLWDVNFESWVEMIDIGHNIATDIFFYGSNFELQNQRRVVGKISWKDH